MVQAAALYAKQHSYAVFVVVWLISAEREVPFTLMDLKGPALGPGPHSLRETFGPDVDLIGKLAHQF